MDRDNRNQMEKVPSYLTQTVNTDGTWTLAVSYRDSFDTGLLTASKFKQAFVRFLKTMITNGIDIEEVIMTKESLVKYQKEIDFLDTKLKTIAVDDDLNLTCEHYKFRHPSRTLKAWSGEYRDKRSIHHPIFFEDDLEIFLQSGLEIDLTLKQLNKLKRLRRQERKQNNTALVHSVQGGYLLQVYELQSNLFDKIVERGRVPYNIATSSGQRKEIKLEYVQKVTYFREGEGKHKNKFHFTPKEHQNVQDDRDHRVFVSKRIVNKEKIGYVTFYCKTFTLPAISSFMLENGLTVIGEDKIYPRFADLTCDVRNPVNHPDHKKRIFQDEAMDAWIKAGMVGTIALPTGSGKTMLGARAIHKIKQATLIVVPTIELVHQWKETLVKWCGIPENKIGLYYGSNKEINEITIITFQSGQRRVRREVNELSEEEYTLVDYIINLSEKVAFVIMDEGHHSPAPIFQKIMVNLKSRYRLSLTATPYREDKNEMLSFLAMGKVVYTKDYGSLAEMRAVAPIRFKRVACYLTAKEEGIAELKTKIRKKQ